MSAVAQFVSRFGWADWPAEAFPVAIAHRGASDHAPENTLKAFRIAADLGAEMWEIDVRVAACGTVVVSHDDTLDRVAGDGRTIGGTTAEDLRAVPLADGERMPTLGEVIALAKDTGSALYIELKDAPSGPATVRLLTAEGFERAVIGAFDPAWIAPLREAGCPYPLSVLVPAGADPLTYGAHVKPDIVHLCWLHAELRPDRLVTDALIAEIGERGAATVTWHEDRAAVIEALQAKPILGICSNRPEVLKPARHRHEIRYVCHRGANTYAPENTLAAAKIAFDQRFDFVEVDVRTTKDGALVVMHDALLDRTTDSGGLVTDFTLEELRRMDAGSWFSDTFRGEPIPTLRDVLDLAKTSSGNVYVEIKYATPRQILEEVTAADMLDRVFFWGADTDALIWLRDQSDDIVLMAPRFLYLSIEAAHEDYRAQIIEFDVTRDDLSEVPRCRELGLMSMIYSQSHNWETLASYIAYAPDLVNLDRPDRFKLIADYGWSGGRRPRAQEPQPASDSSRADGGARRLYKDGRSHFPG